MASLQKKLQNLACLYGRSKGKSKKKGIINAGIAVMSVLLFAFLFSFLNRRPKGGFKNPFFSLNRGVPKLARNL
ncbi:MAG: hypothetical protein CM15mP58_19140 [Burkholderiaceae bacterium]|nr:MAG: hypothetical protein CM15mP58_19140 [Burkholderiaceae bacterium]